MWPLQEVKAKFVEFSSKTVVFFFFLVLQTFAYIQLPVWWGWFQNTAMKNFVVVFAVFWRLEAKNILLKKYALTMFPAKFCKLRRLRFTFILLLWKCTILMSCHLLTVNLQSWWRKDIIWFTYYGHTNCAGNIISNQKELFSSSHLHQLLLWIHWYISSNFPL